MQRMNIKCCHCGDCTPFITEENIEVIPQVNLTRTDMDILGDIAEELAECGCFLAYDFLRRVQSEVTKSVLLPFCPGTTPEFELSFVLFRVLP